MTEKNYMAVNFLFFHTVHSVEKWKIYSHQIKISSNQLFSTFFSKTITLTKYLPKKWEWISVISTLCSVEVWMWSNSIFCIIFVKLTNFSRNCTSCCFNELCEKWEYERKSWNEWPKERSGKMQFHGKFWPFGKLLNLY